MNSTAMNISEDKVSKFTQNLQGANEDWPLLSELSQHKSVLKNKKSSFNVAKTAKEIVKVSLHEDAQMSKIARQDDKLFEESFINEVHDFKASPEVVESVANDVKPLIQVETIKKTISDDQESVSQAQLQENFVIPEPVTFLQEPKVTNALLKLIAIGLTKLYMKKTTSVLNPVKFVAENYRNVLVAILHLGVPVLMSWFLINKVGFIQSQLASSSSVMFWTCAMLFYFASLFVWVSVQVLGAGFVSMLKTALVSVANDIENKD